MKFFFTHPWEPIVKDDNVSYVALLLDFLSGLHPAMSRMAVNAMSFYALVILISSCLVLSGVFQFQAF